MKIQHKAILQRAAKEGLKPMELAHELLGHDLLELMLGQMRSHAVAFKNMSEIQQDSAIQQMTDGLKDAIETAVQVICSQNTKTVRMTLKGLKVGKRLQVTGDVDGDEEFKHELADKAQDQSDVLIVLYERDYLQGLDAIQSEKDQKSLPLGDDKETPAGKSKPKPKGATPKVIDLPPKLVEDAKAFVITQQNTSIPGLQNQLKVAFEKAQALHDRLEADGVLSAKDEHGNRTIIKADTESSVPIEPTEEQYAEACRVVLRLKSISKTSMEHIAGMNLWQGLGAIKRMQEDGIIGEVDDNGQHPVIDLPAA